MLTPECLKKGTVVYIQVCGKLVPRRPWDQRPQPFALKADWPADPMGLEPLQDLPAGCKPIVIDAAGGMV